jgi:integration host factor subunit beta
MVKSEIIQRILILNNQLSRKEVQKIVDALFDHIAKAIVQGNRVEVRGFGTFTTRTRKAGKVRNPRHGTTLESPARRTVYFRPGNILVQRVDIYANNLLIHKNCG